MDHGSNLLSRDSVITIIPTKKRPTRKKALDTTATGAADGYLDGNITVGSLLTTTNVKQYERSHAFVASHYTQYFDNNHLIQILC